jgi:hypothetical protein
MPGADVGVEISDYVVRHERDNRQIDAQVREAMQAMGFRRVTSGLQGGLYPEADITVSCEDRRM